MMDRENEAEGRKDDRDRGQTLGVFALMLTVMVGFVALTVDVGLAFLERRQMQNAVDAAALAAAQDLTVGQSNEIAEATAYDYMDRNGYPEADGLDVNIPPLRGPYTVPSGHAEVLSPKQAPTSSLTLCMAAGPTVCPTAVSERTLRAICHPRSPKRPIWPLFSRRSSSLVPSWRNAVFLASTSASLGITCNTSLLPRSLIARDEAREAVA